MQHEHANPEKSEVDMRSLLIDDLRVPGDDRNKKQFDMLSIIFCTQKEKE
jgi:hypothetical protein